MRGLETYMLVWYWLGGRKVLNFGEHFVELLLPKMGCRPVSFDVERDAGRIVPGQPCLLSIGSEFEVGLVGGLLKAGCHVHVWGQGNGRGADRAIDMQMLSYRERVTIHALRGPLTKRVSHFDGDVPLLDPGFLLPHFYPRWIFQHEGKPIVYVPHHVNTERVTPEILRQVGADKLVDVMVHRDNLRATMAAIASADFALCNSLHALIFCLAYRVPCALCLTKGETLNMPDKWRDVLESLGWPAGGSLPIVANLDQGRRWWESEGRHLVIPDTGPLLAAFPADIIT